MIAGANGQVVGSGTLYATDGSITFELTTTAGVWDDRVTWYIYDSADSFRQDYLQVTIWVTLWVFQLSRAPWRLTVGTDVRSCCPPPQQLQSTVHGQSAADVAPA